MPSRSTEERSPEEWPGRWLCKVLLVSIPVLLAFLSPLSPPGGAEAREGAPRVVILNSYHPGEAWSDNELKGIMDEFLEAYPGWAPSVEYLDAKRFPANSHRDRLARFLEEKYQEQTVDLVLAMDNPALIMLLDNPERLFPGVPVVFCGINGYSPSLLRGRTGITGVFEDQDMAGTLRLAKGLQPGLKRVFAIHDHTETGLAVRRDMDRVLPRFSGQLDIEFSPEIPFTALEEMLQSLTPGSATLLMAYVTDPTGRVFSRAESTELISRASPVPVYAMHEMRLGHGILGGMLLDGRRHGARAAAMALDILRGAAPSDIPVEPSLSKPEFDWVQLNRFGMNPDSLPPGSRVVNRPVSFWQRHQDIALPFTLVAAVLGFWIVMMALSIWRLKQANRIIRRGESRYHSMVRTTTDGFWVLDLEGRILEVNDSYCHMSGYSREQLLAKRIWDLDCNDGPQAFAGRVKGIVGLGWDRIETRHVRAGGAPMDVEISCAYLAEQGRLLCFVRDISERKRSEAALRDSERLLRNIMDTSEDCIFVKDRNLRLALCNEAYARLLGKKAEDLVGNTDLENGWEPDLVKGDPAKGIQGFEAWDREALAGRVVKSPGIGLERDGEVKAFHTVVLPLRDGAGEMIGVLGVSRDMTEQNKALEALRESEQRYRLFYSKTPAMLQSIDARGHLISVSNFWLKKMGYSSQEVLGREFTDFLSEESRDAVRDIYMKRFIAAGGVAGLPGRFVTKSGEILDVLLSAVSERDESGRMVRSLAVVEDVTERKRAETELLAKTGILDAIFETAPFVMMLVNREGRVVEINRAGQDLARRGRDELLGLLGGDVLQCLNAFDGQGCGRGVECASCPVRTRIDHTLSTGEAIYNAEGRMRIMQGGRTVDVDLLISTSPLQVSGDNLVLVCLADISESKRADRARAESERLFRKVFETLPIGLWIADKNGQLLRGNPAGIRIWGGSPLVDQSRYGIFKARRLPSGEGIAPDDWALARTVNEGVTITDEVLEIDAFDGVTRTILNSTAPVLGDEGQIQGAIVVNQDITERMRAEEEKKRLEAQLRQAHKMEAIGTLAGGIAHDFNNILAAITGYAEIALDDAEEGTHNPANLREILAVAERARDLVRGILTFSRKAGTSIKPMDLKRELVAAVRMLERTIPRMVGIDLDLCPEPALIRGDSAQMQQLILNLGSNAKDAMPDGGRLAFRLKPVLAEGEDLQAWGGAGPGRYIELCVRDTGHGMDAETLEHIFDPFFTTKEVGKGTGLGLSTVYGITKSHGGTIVCESRPGEGTEFRLYFPALETTAGEEAEKAVPPTAPAGKGEFILLVDDEQALRELGTMALLSVGYRALTAGSGEEALDIYRQKGRELDLVVMDLGMPGMGGEQCLRRILEMNPGARIIVASGYAAGDQVREALEAGAAGFVPKPFRRAELLAAIRSVLDSKQVSGGDGGGAG